MSLSLQLFEFETGRAVQQTALVDDQALYVFSTNPNETRHLQVFPLTDNADFANSTSITPLPDSLIFVDEIKTGDGQKIAHIHRDKVTLQGSTKTLIEFTSLYNAPVFQLLPRLDVFRDLNGDGLDDFLIPTFEGYQVAVQTDDGSFTPTVTLPATPLMDMSYNSHPWYQAKSIFAADMTGDGGSDLVFWRQGSFIVYPQRPDGSCCDSVHFDSESGGS